MWFEAYLENRKSNRPQVPNCVFIKLFFVTELNSIHYLLQYRIISNIKIPIKEINTDVHVRTQWRHLTRRWWVRVYTVCPGIPLPYASITTVVPIHVHLNGWTGFKYLFIRDCNMRRNRVRVVTLRESGCQVEMSKLEGHACWCILFWLNTEWLVFMEMLCILFSSFFKSGIFKFSTRINYRKCAYFAFWKQER